MFDEDDQGKGHCKIFTKDETTPVGLALEENEVLYELVLTPNKRESALLARRTDRCKWHERLGHDSNDTIRETISIVEGVHMSSVSNNDICESCVKGKFTKLSRTSTPHGNSLPTRPLDLVHPDLKCSLRFVSEGSAKFFATLYEVSGALSLVRLSNMKSETETMLKEMITEIETASGDRIRRLRSDDRQGCLSVSFEK